jgi:hypothetical protein
MITNIAEENSIISKAWVFLLFLKQKNTYKLKNSLKAWRGLNVFQKKKIETTKQLKNAILVISEEQQ